MAQLTRSKRAQVIRPTGIAQMTGLRDAAKGMQQTAQLADQVGGFFYQRGLKEAGERGMTAAYETPSELENRALTTKDGHMYADANGQPIQADLVKQAPRQDPGLFQREEAVVYNKTLAAKEKTDIILAAQRTFENWYLDSSESLDYKSFSAKGQAYLQNVLDGTHDDIKVDVAASIQPYFQKRLNALQVSKRENDIALQKKETELLIDQQRRNVITSLSTHSIEDPGVQDQIAVLAAYYNDRIGKDYSPEMAERDIEAFVVHNVVKAAFVNQIKALSEDTDGFTKGDSVEAAKLVRSLIDGTYEVTAFDAKKGFNTSKKVPISSYIDGDERSTIAKNVNNLLKINNSLRTATKAISNEMFESELNRLVAAANIHKTNGNVEGLKQVQDEIGQLFSNTEDPANAANAAKSMASVRASVLAETERDRVAEARAKTESKKQSNRAYSAATENVLDKQINAFEKMLGSENVSKITGYTLDDDDIDSILGGMTAAKHRVSYKSRQFNLLVAYAETIKPSETEIELSSAIANKQVIEWTKEKAKLYDNIMSGRLKNEPLKNAEGQWDAGEVIDEFGAGFDMGRIPHSVFVAMRTAVATGAEDPQGMMAAYAVYDRIRHAEPNNPAVLDKFLGGKTVDALEHMRRSTLVYGMRPDSTTVLQNVESILSGEKEVLRWNEMLEMNPDKVSDINEFFIDKLGENAPAAMQSELRSAVAGAYQQYFNIDEALKIGFERVIGGEFGKRWGKSNYGSHGSDKWTRYGIEGNFSHIADNSEMFEKWMVKEVTDRMFRVEGKDIYKGKFNFGDIKGDGTTLSLRFAGLDKNKKPEYFVIPTTVEEGTFVFHDAMMRGKDGKALVIKPDEINAAFGKRDWVLGQLRTMDDNLEQRYLNALGGLSNKLARERNPDLVPVLVGISEQLKSIRLSIKALEDAWLSNLTQETDHAISALKKIKESAFVPQLVPIDEDEDVFVGIGLPDIVFEE